MTITACLWVGLGGFCGAVARFGATHGLRTWLGLSAPTATLVVNLSGCLAIGALLPLLVDSSRHAPRLFLVVGLLGSFTTFSTFGWDSHGLLREGRYAAALGSMGAHLVLGLALVGAGAWLASRFSAA